MTAMKDALKKALTRVTKDFVRAKRKAAAADRDELSSSQIERLRKEREREEVIKPAAYAVMQEAYMLASDNGRLPANARQIMYAARPLVLAKAGGKCWKKSNYFTQVLLPAYQEEYPEESAGWDVVYDARGHFVEPHVPYSIGIGTLNVRAYVSSWTDASEDEKKIEPPEISSVFPTKGPKNRYRYALFIEKEGFTELLARSQIAERYDMAIFSSKGQSTTATRQLVDKLSQGGVTILALHDFDRAGLLIAHYLFSDSRRYEFTVEPNVIDLGLRLSDVEEMGLQSEPVEYRQQKNPGDVLLDFDDVTGKEIGFLVENRVGYNRWRGKRVELNAMTSRQFIEWLEEKLEEHGVEKVIPEKATLEIAWQRAKMIARVNAAVEGVMKEMGKEESAKPAPRDLGKRVRKRLDDEPELSWDEALVEIAEEADKR